LAIGGAAAGLVVLGKQFSSRTVAVSSGLVCAILPRTTWAGIEARPYALSMMAAVWLTVLLVYAARRDNAWAWLAYGIVLTISVLLDVYLLLLPVVHVVYLVAFRRSRTVVTRFALTTILAGCALTPFLVTVIGQAHQISWIAPIGRRTIEDVAIQQYFERSPPFTIVSVLILVAAIVLWRFTSAHLVKADRQLLTLAIAWLVIPTALIVSCSSTWVHVTDCICEVLSPIVIRPERWDGSFGSVPIMPHPAATVTAVIAVVRPIIVFRTEHLPLSGDYPKIRAEYTYWRRACSECGTVADVTQMCGRDRAYETMVPIHAGVSPPPRTNANPFLEFRCLPSVFLQLCRGPAPWPWQLPRSSSVSSLASSRPC